MKKEAKPWWIEDLDRLREEQNPNRGDYEQPTLEVPQPEIDSPVRLPEDDKPNRGVEILKILKNKK